MNDQIGPLCRTILQGFLQIVSDRMLLRNVLIVDDEESCRQMLEKALTVMGYSCEASSDASEAMQELARRSFDLVISDLRMEDTDGVQLMKEAQKIYPSLSFIIMTGFASEYRYEDIIDAGAADYLGKPFELGELKAKLERIEREKRTLNELERANEELKQAYAKLGRTLQETVNALGSAVEMRDPYTAGHQVRVAKLACAIAREMGLSEDLIDGIHVAGLIHDIGKVSVPAEILAKPSKLSELECRIIEQHPRVGYDILKNVEFPWPVAAAVFQHHERIDGSGYPQGLLDAEILLEAKILAVADVVETMASHRPYRPALGIDMALQEISKYRATRYCADAVDACLRLIEKQCFKVEYCDDSEQIEIFI
ncbi:MAG: HD-GYP domain-containing protein [Desulforhabdus sp.]|nr:HD-GYP domain-containing protein [Desulforhabdus sp.]